jgi:hypothetical protein
MERLVRPDEDALFWQMNVLWGQGAEARGGRPRSRGEMFIRLPVGEQGRGRMQLRGWRSVYHSSRKLARRVLGPLLSRSFLPTTPLITPGAEVMFIPGFAQFG